MPGGICQLVCNLGADFTKKEAEATMVVVGFSDEVRGPLVGQVTKQHLFLHASGRLAALQPKPLGYL